MKKKLDWKQLFIPATIIVLTATSCQANNGPDPTEAVADMPNPASVYCEDQGYDLEIVTAEDGSQSGICNFPDGSSCEEWAYFRGECLPASEGSGSGDGDAVEATPSTASEGLPSPTINPEDYATWQTYTNAGYGFSFKLPEDWIVREDTGGGLLSGHLITLLPETEGDGMNIRLTFRESGDETLLWPTGVGEGEFIAQGTMQIGSTTVNRNQLVCPSGEITSIWYQGTEGTPQIQLGDLEFGIVFHASATHCTAGISLDGKNQLVGEMIIASLTTP